MTRLVQLQLIRIAHAQPSIAQNSVVCVVLSLASPLPCVWVQASELHIYLERGHWVINQAKVEVKHGGHGDPEWLNYFTVLRPLTSII